MKRTVISLIVGAFLGLLAGLLLTRIITTLVRFSGFSQWFSEDNAAMNGAIALIIGGLSTLIGGFVAYKRAGHARPGAPAEAGKDGHRGLPRSLDQNNLMKHASDDVVALAAGIAKAAHEGQFRRDGTTPYIRHPESVAARLRGDPSAEAAGWLHDVLEDTRETAASLRAQGVPENVVACVETLTKREGLDYEQYIRNIREDPMARKVKIADMLSNLGDNPSEKQIIKYAKSLLALLA